MKIIGEKSLSSNVIIGLDVIFAIISLIDIWVFSVILKVVVHISMNENIQSNVTDLVFFATLLITGIIALLVIYQLIKIFKNLKKNILFCNDNLVSLKKITIKCFILSVLYLALAIIGYTFLLKLFIFSSSFMQINMVSHKYLKPLVYLLKLNLFSSLTINLFISVSFIFYLIPFLF